MKQIILLKEAGNDTDSIIASLGGNQELYLSICKKFMMDPSFSLFQAAVSIKDMQSARTHIHTLKGVAANLGFSRLHSICASIMEDIHNNCESISYMKQQKLREEYKKIIEIIHQDNQLVRD